MAVVKVKLTKDLIKLISNIRFCQYKPIKDDDERQEIYYGIDINSLYGGDFLFEDMSFILGIYDKHIIGTEEDAEGPDFHKEDKYYMWELHSYILDNLQNIEEIVHQFVGQGGLKEGTYTCKSNEHIWIYKE